MIESIIDEKNSRKLTERYQEAVKRLILLDYDGTLTPIVPLPEMAKPSGETLDVLRELTDDDRNTVYIISGRDTGTLNEWLGFLPVHLIAEHGAWFRTAGTEWQVNGDLNTSWIDPVRRLLEQFVDQCPESFIETKSFSLAWHYRNSEQTKAMPLARKLLTELAGKAEKLNVDLIDGNKVIEVKNRGISKGEAIKKLLSGDFDFILACGDDTTDEDMFRELKGLPEAITVKIGDQPTAASFRVESSKKLIGILKTLTGLKAPGKEQG